MTGTLTPCAILLLAYVATPPAAAQARRNNTHPWVSWLHEQKTYAGKLESAEWLAGGDFRTQAECLKEAEAEISALEVASRATDARVTRINRFKLRYEEKGNRYLIVSETMCYTKRAKPVK